MKCSTSYCRNNARPKGKTCHACRSKLYRAKNPVAAAYHLLKSNAKRRGKVFSISLDYFKQFCREFDYIRGKGKTKTSYTVECKINELGYVEGNLQVLPLVENARKGVKRLEYDWRTGEAIVRSETVEQIENLHF